jgi:hypothetical protein
VNPFSPHLARWRRPSRLALALFLVALGGVAFNIWWQREPQLHGRPISHWVLPWKYSAFESSNSVAAAHAAMGPSHVRWLQRQLAWRPSLLRGMANTIAEMLQLPIEFEDSKDYREQAATVLGRLGDRARPAVQSLLANCTTPIEPRAFQARVAAKAALIELGAASAEPVIQAARSPAHPDWFIAADVLARLESRRREAAAIFSEIMHGTNAPSVRHRAINLYCHCRPPSSETVSNLCRLASADPSTRSTVLSQLRNLGFAASNALPVISSLLQDPDPEIRRQATILVRNLQPALITNSAAPTARADFSAPPPR